VDRAPLPFDTGRCLCYPHLGQFHPLKYLDGLLKALWKRGGRVYGHTHADGIEGDGKTARVTTRAGATVTAGSVVVTTNTPVNDKVAIHTKQSPWRTYVIGFRVPTGSIPHGLYWDTEDPYHYVCPHMGCVVKWNHGESTWDCPCHGSRFDAYGRVVNGPANEDLRRIEVTTPQPQRQAASAARTAP
jgi:Rieske Fe-S protein